MRIVPVTLREANKYVKDHHRHHKMATGHRFSIGVRKGDSVVGYAIVGRPVSRGVPQYTVAEVSRLVTDGSKNVCSMLYGAAARICREMGYDKIQTYILASEPGTSLKAAGWTFEGMTAGGDWNCKVRKNRRTDQPQEPKARWSKVLR